MAKGALDGVRVLDFGHYIPGPLLGMFLSDQGASVIKVERPDGDPARKHPAFATWNRGKQSVVLDLKSEAGQTHARTLAANSDVVIENFRPGVADRLGIGYEALSEVNPKLVYCSLPGFGEGSPHRHSQGWEPIVGAATGLYEPARDSDGPVYTPVPAASTFSAIIGAVSVTMALIARHRNGQGPTHRSPSPQCHICRHGTAVVGNPRARTARPVPDSPLDHEPPIPVQGRTLGAAPRHVRPILPPLPERGGSSRVD